MTFSLPDVTLGLLEAWSRGLWHSQHFSGDIPEVSSHRVSGNDIPGCSVASRVLALWILSVFYRCGSQVMWPAIRKSVVCLFQSFDLHEWGPPHPCQLPLLAFPDRWPGLALPAEGGPLYMWTVTLMPPMA